MRPCTRVPYSVVRTMCRHEGEGAPLRVYTDALREAVANRSAVVVYGIGVSRSISDNAPTAGWVGLIRNGITHARKR